MINLESENSRNLDCKRVGLMQQQHDPQLSFSALCFLRNRFFSPVIPPASLDMPVNAIFPLSRKESFTSPKELLKNPASANISPIPFNNSLMTKRPRSEKKPIPENQKDEKYFERRKRNNEAAKKSRDARKIREDRVSFISNIYPKIL